MELSTAPYGIRNLESRRRATSGRWWIIVVFVAVVACAGISALYCKTCQSNANAALAASNDPTAWICNYYCDTTLCATVGATCRYNICTKKNPNGDGTGTDDDSGSGETGTGGGN